MFESPTYGYYKEMGITEREVKNIRARYAGECTMVDNCVGRLLATLDKLNILDDTAIIFTSDHGTYFGYPGDNGLIGKANFVEQDGMLYPGGRWPQEPYRHSPQYTGVCRIPLFIRMPGQNKMRRFAQITQPWDFAPTILEMYGLEPSEQHIGQSLLPVIQGKQKSTRKIAIVGLSMYNIQAMNEDWIYTLWRRPEEKNGTIQPPSLIDLKNDPLQKKNVARKHPEICKALYKEIVAFVKSQPNVPDEFLQSLVMD